MVANLPDTVLEPIGLPSLVMKNGSLWLRSQAGQRTELNRSYNSDESFSGKLEPAGTWSCPSTDLPDQGKVFYMSPFL